MRYFDATFHQVKLRGTIFGVSDPRVVCIHGASQEGSARFDMLRQHLSKAGIASLGFDFIGAGQTGGEVLGSSLKERLEQARTVIDSAHLQKPLVLIGASMGADTAIRLTREYPTSALMLFVPGVYARSAYAVPFGEEFSSILHEDRSWEQSDTWEILSEFTGSLFVIGAEEDEVVPREIIDRIIASAGNAKQKELHIVPRSPHRVLPYLNDHHDQFARVFEKVYHTIVNSQSA